MLKIDEVIPLYICKYAECTDWLTCRTGINEEKPGYTVICHHTMLPIDAKNPESAELLDKFFNTFDVKIDELGRLVCKEKEDVRN